MTLHSGLLISSFNKLQTTFRVLLILESDISRHCLLLCICSYITKLTPWGTVSEKIIVTKVVEKFTAFYRKRKCIFTCIRACHCSLSWTQNTPIHCELGGWTMFGMTIYSSNILHHSIYLVKTEHQTVIKFYAKEGKTSKEIK